MADKTINLGGLSEAEWEYACKFLDYIDLGEAEPSSDGFDPARIRLIERAIRTVVRDKRDAVYRDLRNRMAQS